MRKLLLLCAGLLFASGLASAQVIGQFDSTGNLDGWTNNGSAGTDSLYQTTNPTGATPGCMGWHMTLNATNTTAQIGKSSINTHGAQLVTFWVYIPKNQNMPDTTEVGVAIMDNHNWSWKEVDVKASTIPKDTWYPLSISLAQLDAQYPTQVDTKAYTIWAGMQIYGTQWSGLIYVNNITLIGAAPKSLLSFKSGLGNFAIGWNNGWATTLAPETGLVGDSMNTVKFQIRDSVVATYDTTNGIIDTSYARPTGTAYAADVADGGNYDFSKVNFLACWIWADTTLPDSAQLQLYCQDRLNWTNPSPVSPTIYYGVNIPKRTWYPIYINLSQLAILDSSTFDPAKNKIGWFGLYLGATTDSLVDTATVYISGFQMLNDVAAIAPPVWVAADFSQKGSGTNAGKQGFKIPSWASGSLQRYGDINLGYYVLKGNANFSPTSTRPFAAVRDSIPMTDAADSTVISMSMGLYLPFNMPRNAVVTFFASGGAGDSVAVQDTVGKNGVMPGQVNTLTLTKLDSLAKAEATSFDPSKPASVGVEIYYPAPYDTVTWSGPVEITNLTITGIWFPNQLLDGVQEISSNVPKQYELYPNYPNPFNPSTVIQYALPKASHVVVKVYDVLGREVTTLVNSKEAAGVYKVHFNMDNYASGVYFVRMSAGNYVHTEKMMLLK